LESSRKKNQKLYRVYGQGKSNRLEIFQGYLSDMLTYLAEWESEFHRTNYPIFPASSISFHRLSSG
jgi:hypothetical protein